MNGFLRIFEQRVRGVRLIELIGLVLVFAMIFWVCLSKAREGDDVRRMNQLDQQIADQQAAVDALRIKVSQLERPERLESLAKTYLDMKPVDPNHEAGIDAISQISRATSPAAARPAAPVSATPQSDLITAAEGSASKAAASATAVAAPVVTR